MYNGSIIAVYFVNHISSVFDGFTSLSTYGIASGQCLLEADVPMTDL